MFLSYFCCLHNKILQNLLVFLLKLHCTALNLYLFLRHLQKVLPKVVANAWRQKVKPFSLLQLGRSTLFACVCPDWLPAPTPHTHAHAHAHAHTHSTYWNGACLTLRPLPLSLCPLSCCTPFCCVACRIFIANRQCQGNFSKQTHIQRDTHTQ